MLSNIDVYRYTNDDSLIHRMPSFIKLIWNILFIIVQFLCRDLVLMISLFIMIFLIIELSHIKRNIYFKVIWGLKYLFIFLILIYFYIENDILLGILMCFRCLNIVLITTILITTTSPFKLIDGIKKILLPFKFILPINKIAFSIYLSLRFIPTIIEVANKIMKSQASRGVDYKASKLKIKLLSIKTMLVPIFVITMKKADNLAEALEIRLYDINSNRTYIQEEKFKLFDFVGLAMIISIFVFLIIRVW